MKDTLSILWYHFRVRLCNHSWNNTPDIWALLSVSSVPMSKTLKYSGMEMRFQGSISLEVSIISFELHTQLHFFFNSFINSVFNSVAQLCLTLCNPMDCSTPGLPVHHQLLEFTQVHWVSDANHLILCCHLQSFPASGSFQMSQFFASGGQTIGVSTSTSVLPFPLGWTGWISLQSKGLSRVFSNTTVQKHQFFGAHLFL